MPLRTTTMRPQWHLRVFSPRKLPRRKCPLLLALAQVSRGSFELFRHSEILIQMRERWSFYRAVERNHDRIVEDAPSLHLLKRRLEEPRLALGDAVDLKNGRK